jgi:hypothetical protein
MTPLPRPFPPDGPQHGPAPPPPAPPEPWYTQASAPLGADEWDAWDQTFRPEARRRGWGRSLVADRLRALR